MRALGARPPRLYPRDRDDWEWHHYAGALIHTIIGGVVLVGVLLGPLAMAIAAALGGSLPAAVTHLFVQVVLWAAIGMLAAL
jgi:hypothetical protein